MLKAFCSVIDQGTETVI